MAPSPVSALLSGVLIKFGIYGLVRVLGYLGPPPAWWAWVLIGLGLVSGVWGILNAVVQRDLKRLLAYSSVENVGIIVLGLGLGLYGKHTGSADMMPRNLDRRVELLFPVLNPKLVRYLRDVVLEKYLSDTRKVRLGRPDGTYEAVGSGTMDSQAWFTAHKNAEAV